MNDNFNSHHSIDKIPNLSLNNNTFLISHVKIIGSIYDSIRYH